jgi:RNase P protein component
VDAYLSGGKRFTSRGVTLYIKPTDNLEVGFLIRGRAGNAVARVRTRRLFWGILNNQQADFPPQGGFVFLFHRSFRRSADLLNTVQALIKRSQRT